MERKCRVAIIVCLKHQMHNTIAMNLMKNLQTPTATGLNYTVGVATTEFNERSLRLKMSLSIQGNYDVVVVIGDFFSATLAQKIYKELMPIPTVFIGVSDPVKLGLVKSLEQPGGSMSGVIANANNIYVSYLEKISLFYPYISRILIPYDPDCSSGMVGQAALFGAEYLRSKGFLVTLREAKTAVELRSSIEQHIDLIDAIWLIEGCILSTAVNRVAYTCWKHNKILFSSGSRDGIEAGAACSNGFELSKLSVAAGEMVRRYWEGRLSFAVQPVIELSGERTLFLNEVLLAQMRIPQEVIDRVKSCDNVIGLKIWVNCPV